MARLLLVLALTVGLIVTSGAVAFAGQYSVLACDASSTVQGASVNRAWTFDASAGHAPVNLCPSNGNEQRGIVTRITERVNAGTYERANFVAPPGTSITSLKARARANRGSCAWKMGIFARPSNAAVLGLANGDRCETSNFFFDTPLQVSPPAGTTQLYSTVQCGAATCDPGATMNLFSAEVTIDDPVAPVPVVTGGLGSADWVRGERPINFRATDNAGATSAGLEVDGIGLGGTPFTCDFTVPAPCPDRDASLSVRTAEFPDGPHTANLVLGDVGGNLGGTKIPFRSDNTPPERIQPTVAGGEGWRRTNSFDVGWATPPQPFAPIVGARYRLCRTSGDQCEDGYVEGQGIDALRNLPVKRLGESRLEVWLRDEAGNETSDGAAQLTLRLDPEAPRLAFLPQDPNDPLTVAVSATDAYSGVAEGRIEMRRRGSDAWQALPTRIDGSRLVADIDDEGARRGLYEFRAYARDVAGNEASTGTQSDGSATAIRIPVRVSTRLRAGFERTKVRRRVVRRKGKRRVVRKRIKVLARSRRLGYGRRAIVRGRLTNPDGQPLTSVTLQVQSRQALKGSRYKLRGYARTDKRGRFSYQLRGTSSRILRFRFAGSRRIAPASRVVQVEVPAAGSMKADRPRVLNGQAVTFTGRVATRPVPSVGKLVEIQAFFRGRWRTISTTRTNARGRWSFRYRFGATSGLVRYRFRALYSAEGGYPFATGRSRVVSVIVRGL